MKKETNVRETFRRRLSQLRAESGLSQSKLAKQLGISPATIGYYENGERLPDIDIAARIAVFFDVTADYLLGFSDARTTEKSMKTSCEVTGLSEEAINNLLNIKSENKMVLNALSEMINTIDFQIALEQICDTARRKGEKYDFYKVAFDFFAKEMALDDFGEIDETAIIDAAINRQHGWSFFSEEERYIENLFETFVIQICFLNYDIANEEFEITRGVVADLDYEKYRINKKLQSACSEVIYELFEPDNTERLEMLERLFDRNEATLKEIIEKQKKRDCYKHLQEMLKNDETNF